MAYRNPPGVSGGPLWVNTEAWRLAEIPSTNGHGTARGVARVYHGLLEGLIDADLLAEATTEHSAGHDLILERPSRFGLGYQLTQPERPLGPNRARSAISAPAARWAFATRTLGWLSATS